MGRILAAVRPPATWSYHSSTTRPLPLAAGDHRRVIARGYYPAARRGPAWVAGRVDRQATTSTSPRIVTTTRPSRSPDQNHGPATPPRQESRPHDACLPSL